jgi:HK97 gp10 family phage protein
MAFNLNIVGLKELQIKVSNLRKSGLRKEVNHVLEAGAKTFVRNAKRDAPVDFGVLRNLITYEKTGQSSFSIVSGANYSAYIEFGTRSRAVVPADLQTYASQFRGKGVGDYYDFLNAILDWVKRKGLSDVTNSYTGKKVGGKAAKENLVVLAEAIALSILRHGIKPHPYFFKQRAIVKPMIEKNIKAITNSIKL